MAIDRNSIAAQREQVRRRQIGGGDVGGPMPVGGLISGAIAPTPSPVAGTNRVPQPPVISPIAPMGSVGGDVKEGGDIKDLAPPQIAPLELPDAFKKRAGAGTNRVPGGGFVPPNRMPQLPMPTSPALPMPLMPNPEQISLPFPQPGGMKPAGRKQIGMKRGLGGLGLY